MSRLMLKQCKDNRAAHARYNKGKSLFYHSKTGGQVRELWDPEHVPYLYLKRRDPASMP
jgi:hypothetical protein